MADYIDGAIRDELLVRRRRLEAAAVEPADTSGLRDLLRQVDAALERLDQGTYGICETCKEPIEAHRVAANPLICFCLDHLPPAEQRALERDLKLAARIQHELLPPRELLTRNWAVAYHYEGRGPVSGDYCDLIQADGTLFFVVGDVAGKGVAASMLMSQLHAIFRTLVSLGTPADQLLDRANGIFCDAKLPGQYATLVCGRADGNGRVELANAGHCPPILVRAGGTGQVEHAGLPLGLFCDTKYTGTTVELDRGDSILLYTDGVSECRNGLGHEYGAERLARLAAERAALAPPALIKACLDDLMSFSAGAQRADDLTLMVIRRVG